MIAPQSDYKVGLYIGEAGLLVHGGTVMSLRTIGKERQVQRDQEFINVTN